MSRPAGLGHSAREAVGGTSLRHSVKWVWAPFSTWCGILCVHKVLSQMVSEGGMPGGGRGGLAATPALCQLPAGAGPAQLSLITAGQEPSGSGLVPRESECLLG